MADYISREALLEKAWDADTRAGYVQVVDVGDILAAPAADVVEVVRLATDNAPAVRTILIVQCGDCKYHDYNNENEMYCKRCYGPDDMKPDDFCSRGERRNE